MTNEKDAIDWRQHDDLCGLLTGFTAECDCAAPLPDDSVFPPGQSGEATA